MLSLQTNVASLTSQNSVGMTQKQLSTSMTRLGTGYRVNSAMDDAAGLQIATRLNAQTRGMAVAQKNTQNGISMLQTAEGALSEVTNILLRMKDLATEYSNATTTTKDQTALDAEYTELAAEMDNILNNTSFGGETLFATTLAAAITFQIGASTAETMEVDVTTELGNVTGHGLTNLATDDIDAINTVIDDVGALRSKFGAAANRLDHVYNNLANMKTNTDAAKGRIMDVDYASETANMTAKQMLMQAGTSMLKQSNSMSQLVMSLMQ